MKDSIIIVSFFALFVVFGAAFLSHGQVPAQKPSAVAVPPPRAPALTLEQRQKFAAVREALNKDPEYSAAVRRLQEAQMAANKIFFAKLRKAAPELDDYIRYMESANGLNKPAQP